ncbi:MAG: RNA polymerase factor sigma-54 [Proteobacteria bacterium]|nr:RNA polymerase factor sigma-54 [Pseudomonadota bacterium]
MALSPRLEIRLGQTLVMTPQLQQAIKLLQLSSLELSAFVETELEQNPLLERDTRETDSQREENRDGPSESVSETPEPDSFTDGAETPDTVELTDAEHMPTDGDSPLDADYGNEYEPDGVVDVSGDSPAAFADIGGNRGRGNVPDDENGFESSIATEQSLRDYLTEQLNVDIVDPVERIIGVHLIDSLDESGWIAGDLETIAETLNCELSRIESVLDTLQRFDPPGVFARNLRECLALQLREKDRLDPAMETLLANLDKLARQDMKGLLKICEVDMDDLADMIDEIRALNPKPALAFEHEVAQTIIPDILMRPGPDGGWIVELNPETLPRVLVNTSYYATVAKGSKTKEDKEYIAERFQSASWLVKSLDQRANTILKVATEIIRQQQGFFVNGVDDLRPLVLRDIAEVIEMHESTVSRVTTNKYMATPRGLFELKYFFTSSIASAVGGDAHSAESVRHRIKNLIEEETPETVYSDDRLVELLNDSGIDIARRTVAKYREALKIPSSIQRKRQKSQMLR